MAALPALMLGHLKLGELQGRVRVRVRVRATSH